MIIKWNVTKEEVGLIHKIGKRVVEIVKEVDRTIDLLELEMDITAVHLNGCPLDLKKLIDFDDFNFSHDIFGILRHIDRKTGKLLDCFSPRCSK